MTTRSRPLVAWPGVRGGVLLGGAALALSIAFGVELALRGPGGVAGSIQRALAGTEKNAGVDWTVVGRGFREVTDIQFVPGAPQKAVILMKSGTARLLDVSKGTSNAEESPIVFRVAVVTRSELGLLGLAFHPKYEANGLFYVNDNPEGGPLRTRVSEWKLTKERLGKEQAVRTRVLLEVEQPYSNHNAGQLAFGPDGMLYVGLGDGGSAGDPRGHGQNLGTLLGSMLRIDVDRRDEGRPYGIPKDNPFVGKSGARPEIWAYGLRNPWRYSFDPKGRLVVADVGQYAWEEVTLVERGSNHGWNVREGRHCYPADAACTTKGFTEPIYEYDHSVGLSITGGYVYTGKAIPELRGKYVFGDFATGRVFALDLPEAPGKAARATPLGKWPRAFSTFGRDARGEIYAGDFGGGDILRLDRARVGE
ncbi:MAG TPA: PQQ-dependent sugar dehydrogenase [Polyangiaceae bacterium]|nr:PQQ-dependent sugar dehydrogenase [Polyangiaceae bacterium]